MSESKEDEQKTGFQKIISFFNDGDKNKPAAIAEVVERTGLSWSYVKKVLEQLKRENYCGFHFEKSGNTWMSWKDRDKILKKPTDTCGHMLKEE